MIRTSAAAAEEGGTGSPVRSLPPRARRGVLIALACLGAWLTVGATEAAAAPSIGSFAPNPSPIASTVPSNGDVNPYGIVTVPRSVGLLHRGDVLISNFNNSNNLQGTGTTIVQIPPGGGSMMPGTAPVFAQINPSTLPGSCPGGVGLTTALAVTRSGFVIVGSLPTSDGTSATAQAGCLLVLNSQGQVVETIAGGPIDGPWDMTAIEHGHFVTLFVTNVLNGTVAASPAVVNQGTVVRLTLLAIPGRTPAVVNEQVVATGFPERTDPAALVIGPTGVAVRHNGTLYVADSLDNQIVAIPDALSRGNPFAVGLGASQQGAGPGAAKHGGGPGGKPGVGVGRGKHGHLTRGAHRVGAHHGAGGVRTVFSGAPLNDPLGMTLARNGDILTANGNDGNIVEISPNGRQVTTVAADAAGGAGVLFGLALSPRARGLYFVDDGDNTLRLLAP